MKKELFKKGFKAVAEETERREKAKEAKKGKLFRFFLKKDEEDIPIRFLTEEPICFWEHTVKEGTQFSTIPCTGDDCDLCADGNKPRYVSAWLIVDRREGKYKDKDGNEKTYKDRIKLLVRGMKDASILERLSKKYGLTNREYTVTRTGEGTSTTWNFDRGDNDKLTPKQLEAILAQLPEKLSGMSLEDIVIAQIVGYEDDEEETSSTEKAEDVDTSEGLSAISTDEESEEAEEAEEEEVPQRKPSAVRKSITRKK